MVLALALTLSKPPVFPPTHPNNSLIPSNQAHSSSHPIQFISPLHTHLISSQPHPIHILYPTPHPSSHSFNQSSLPPSSSIPPLTQQNLYIALKDLPTSLPTTQFTIQPLPSLDESSEASLGGLGACPHEVLRI